MEHLKIDKYFRGIYQNFLVVIASIPSSFPFLLSTSGTFNLLSSLLFSLKPIDSIRRAICTKTDEAFELASATN